MLTITVKPSDESKDSYERVVRVELNDGVVIADVIDAISASIKDFVKNKDLTFAIRVTSIW